MVPSSETTTIPALATSATTPQQKQSNYNHRDDPSMDDVDWEEWDGTSPFWVHCVAGSVAGVVEHAVVYPLDTVRTHIQVCASCVQRMRDLHHLKYHPHLAHGMTTAATVAQQQQQQQAQLLVKDKSWLWAASAGRKGTSGTLGKATATAAGTTGGIGPSGLPTGMWQTIRFLMNESAVVVATTSSPGRGSANAATALWGEPAAVATASLSSPLKSASTPSFLAGWLRLWRGVDAILIGCVPAHALYFGSYEAVKAATQSWATNNNNSNNSNATAGTHASTSLLYQTMASSAAGAVAVFGHDIIMTPLDTLKQRMQLGHYHGGILPALSAVYQQEGWWALYRSFPITLASNIPYGAIMVTVNEACKETYRQETGCRTLPLHVILASASAGGFMASAMTTPLDRIKTALQTQQLVPACLAQQIQRQEQVMTALQNAASNMGPSSAAGGTTNAFVPPPHCPVVAAAAAASSSSPVTAVHTTWNQAARTIWQQEGWMGFFRGMVPRMLSHTPAAAISWTTYELAKSYLLKHMGEEN